MKQRPKCDVEGCDNDALLLFGDKYICGLCMTKYDRAMKEKQFNQLQEVLGNGSKDLS